jgi:hypothetical protein
MICLAFTDFTLLSFVNAPHAPVETGDVETEFRIRSDWGFKNEIGGEGLEDGDGGTKGFWRKLV